MNRANLLSLRAARSHAGRGLYRSGGFSLIEMMVVVAVLAVLAAFAAPSYKEFIAQSRIDSAYGELNNALAFARTEAIRTRNQVVVAGKPVASCRSAGSTQDWSCGLVIFVDTNRDGAQDASEPALREVGEFVGLDVMHVGGASNARVTYNPFGVNTSAPGRFVFTQQGGTIQSTMCLSTGGRSSKHRGAVCPP